MTKGSYVCHQLRKRKKKSTNHHFWDFDNSLFMCKIKTNPIKAHDLWEIQYYKNLLITTCRLKSVLPKKDTMKFKLSVPQNANLLGNRILTQETKMIQYWTPDTKVGDPEGVPASGFNKAGPCHCRQLGRQLPRWNIDLFLSLVSFVFLPLLPFFSFHNSFK